MIINSGGDSYRKGKLTLLWSGGNSDPVAFAAQTISLDLRGYDTLYIVSVVSTTTKVMTTNVIMNDSDISHLIGLNSGAHTYARTVTLTDEGITFSTGQTMYNGAVSASSNLYVIPIAIYGY